MLNIDSISSSGDFAQTNTCGSSVQPGASCTISVTFTPTLPGSRSGSLTLTDNNNGVSGSVQTIALTGTGLGPLVSLSLASLAFGYHLVGTPSLARTLMLANTGTAPMSIRSLAASSGFTQTNTCGSSLAAGANCAIRVTFSPAAVGPAAGAITITDNAPGSPHVVSLTGIGAPTLTFTFPARIDFGNEPVAAPSAPQTVTLANASNQPLLVRRLLPTRRFAQANNCGVSIAPGSSCSIQVTFTPIAKLPSRGLLIILDTGRPRFAIVRLSGNGT